MSSRSTTAILSTTNSFGLDRPITIAVPERVPSVTVIEIALSEFVAEDGTERLRVPALVDQYASRKASKSGDFEMPSFSATYLFDRSTTIRSRLAQHRILWLGRKARWES
jgi:hypothetical protein